MSMSRTFRSKDELREYVWKVIERYSKFPPPYGRIPNFVGAERACEKLRELEAYRRAEVVFCAPDSPLRRAREIALEDRKILIVAKPKMTGFLLVERGSTIKEMMRYGRKVDPRDYEVYLIVQGCVAVDRRGNRIGKGSGFGDREYALLKKSKNCVYVVIAHPVQVFDDFGHLMEEHDVRVDVIITPEGIICCRLLQ